MSRRRSLVAAVALVALGCATETTAQREQRLARRAAREAADAGAPSVGRQTGVNRARDVAGSGAPKRESSGITQEPRLLPKAKWVSPREKRAPVRPQAATNTVPKDEQTALGLASIEKRDREAAATKPASRGREPPKRSRGVLAVFDIDDKGQLSATERDFLTEILATSLSAAGFRVVPRAQLRDRIASEKGKSYDSCFDEACQIELGKAMAAEKSLATQIISIQNECTVMATLFDLRTETAEGSVVVDQVECTSLSMKRALIALAGQLP